MRTVIHAAAAALLFLGLTAASVAKPIAPTPPMGWNSWDAYGFTVSEAQFKANAEVLATLKPYGWTTAVIDEGWYMGDPLGGDLKSRAYHLDAHGRLEPVTRRFPSAADGHGLKALADWTHAKGLKFGIHIVRGIPKAAVEAKAPIAGSRFTADAAADRSATCPWDDANWGVADNAAGQAYYDDLMRHYAAWGVDFLKVDCISDHPYRPTEIRQIGQAIRKAGRPMVLSLSPGPSRLENYDAMVRQAQMWRIADDLWDGWTFPHAKPTEEFPNGVLSAFDNLAKWNSHVGPDSWPDADMLPFGSLRPHPGWGDPRHSRLTAEETRTAFTLWAIARSPLILGGDLTVMDHGQRALLTNREILALNQRAGTSQPVGSLPDGLENARVWTSRPDGTARPDTVAVFNLADTPLDLSLPWSALGIARSRPAARNLWTGERLPPGNTAHFHVAPHGAAVWRID